MKQSVMNNIKMGLLGRVETLVQRHYHQSLDELMNELYVRRLAPNEDPTADEMFVVLHDNRILATIVDPEARELHDAVAALLAGTYGRCVNCRQEIDPTQIEKSLTARYCTSCLAARDRSYAVVLEAMKSVDVFPW